LVIGNKRDAFGVMGWGTNKTKASRPVYRIHFGMMGEDGWNSPPTPLPRGEGSLFPPCSGRLGGVK